MTQGVHGDPLRQTRLGDDLPQNWFSSWLDLDLYRKLHVSIWEDEQKGWRWFILKGLRLQGML